MGKFVKKVAEYGIGIGASLYGFPYAIAFAKKIFGPSKGASSPTNVDRLRANIDPRTPRKTVVGITALATDIRDEEFTDSQEYFHRFIVCASHTVESIDEIWFDDEMAWSVGGGVTSEFSGYLTVAVREEGSAANAINVSARMGTTRRYTGLAYVHLRYKLTGISNKTDSPFAQSITTRITIRGKGAMIYDARLDSTVEGGSGSHRADDQSTWTWDADACRNPANQLLFYLLGWKINGLLAVGKGIPPSRIDLASFAVAANICDETVTAFGGGSEPRYRSDGMWSEGDDPETVIDQLKAAMNADLDDVDGKLRLTVFHNDLAMPVADFTDDDILDDFDWNPADELDQSYNVVRGLYTDPSDDALYQMVDYPQVETPSPDDIIRLETANFAMVQNASQAQRLAKMQLQRQKFGGTFAASFQATAWKVQKNSIVRLTFAPRGWTNKLFRVAEMDIQTDGVVPLVLREESADIYDPPTLAAPVSTVASVPWDPALDPLIQGIGDAIADAATAQGTADGKVQTFYQGSAPTAEGVGDLWIDTSDDNKLYRWDASLAWIAVDDARIQQALVDAGIAQATADGKIATFYQNSPPTAEGVGDFWVDGDDDNKLYRWSGSAWVAVRDNGAAYALDGLNPDGSVATGKVVTDSIEIEAVVAKTYAFTAGAVNISSGSYTYQEVQAAIATTTGEDVEVEGSFEVDVNDNCKYQYRLLRDGVQLIDVGPITVNTSDSPFAFVKYVDSPTAGTYEYTLEVACNDAGDIDALNRGVFTKEIKR